MQSGRGQPHSKTLACGSMRPSPSERTSTHQKNMNKTMRRHPGQLLTLFFLAAAVRTFGAQINVPADQPTIQAGINAAVNGDTVLVAPGTYNESITIAGKDIVVISSGGPNVTFIDAHRTNR